MDIREEVNSCLTKNKHGFTRGEYMKLLENYPGINMDRFWDALNGITCMSIGNFVYPTRQDLILLGTDIIIAILRRFSNLYS